MDLGLSGRKVLVTGASSGIGRATAIAFAREGASVALTYHSNRNGADETVRQISAAGGQSLVVPLDLGDPASIEAAVAYIVERWEHIDILVNNAVEWGTAAIGRGALRFEDVPPQQWQRMLRTSLDGVLHTTQAVLRSMRTRGWGRIIFVSSTVVDHGTPGMTGYGAAKSGLHGLARSLARELGSNGILVNVVKLGLVATDTTLRYVPQQFRDFVVTQTLTGRLTTTDDAATAIVFLASAVNGNITGEIVRVAGGLR